MYSSIRSSVDPSKMRSYMKVADGLALRPNSHMGGPRRESNSELMKEHIKRKYTSHPIEDKVSSVVDMAEEEGDDRFAYNMPSF